MCIRDRREWPEETRKGNPSFSHGGMLRSRPLSSNRVAADDNPMKLMSIAMRPLSQPPFPLERIEEMTALMAGDGRLYPEAE